MHLGVGSMERISKVLAICAVVVSVVMAADVTLPPDEFYVDDYPNPQVDYRKCNREKPSYICDPNKLITDKEADQLDLTIENIWKHTKCPCSNQVCTKNQRGFQVAIALVKKISPKPRGAKTTTEPTTTPHHKTEAQLEKERIDALDDNLQEVTTFAQQLAQKWNYGQCQEYAIIVYSVWDNVIFTVTSEESRALLKNYLISEIQMKARRDLRPVNGNIARGLLKIIVDYKLVFNGKYNSTTNYNPMKPEVGQLTSAAKTITMTTTSLIASVASLILALLH